MRLFLTALISCCSAFSQQQQPAASPLLTDEEIAAIFTHLSQRAAQMEPMLEQLHPNDWIAKGASDTYLTQWNSTVEQVRAIQRDMSAVAQHPERLPDSMKALFRVQDTRQRLGSLMAGARKYQNPALADLIESVAAEATSDIDRYEQYLLDLAQEKEQQFTVVDREAQRCRANLLRQPAAPPNRKPQ